MIAAIYPASLSLSTHRLIIGTRSRIRKGNRYCAPPARRHADKHHHQIPSLSTNGVSSPTTDAPAISMCVMRPSPPRLCRHVLTTALRSNLVVLLLAPTHYRAPITAAAVSVVATVSALACNRALRYLAARIACAEPSGTASPLMYAARMRCSGGFIHLVAQGFRLIAAQQVLHAISRAHTL